MGRVPGLLSRDALLRNLGSRMPVSPLACRPGRRPTLSLLSLTFSEYCLFTVGSEDLNTHSNWREYLNRGRGVR